MMRECTDFGSGSWLRAVRNASSENISAISERISRCCCVTWSGISRKNSRLTGLPSGDSNGIGSARRTKAASGDFSVLAPIIGYQEAAKIAKESLRTGKSLRQIAEKKKLFTTEQLTRIFRVEDIVINARTPEHGLVLHAPKS